MPFTLASPTTSAFLVIMASRLPQLTFRGLLSVHSRCGPQGPLTSFEAVSRSASAHSLPPGPLPVLPAGARVGRVGLAPTNQPCLCKAHTITPLRMPSGRFAWVGATGFSRVPNGRVVVLRPSRVCWPPPSSTSWSLTPGFGRPWRNSRLGLTVGSMNYCRWAAQAKDKAWISPPCWPP